MQLLEEGHTFQVGQQTPSTVTINDPQDQQPTPMVTVQAAGGGMNVRMHKNPFDGLSQMSAPDLSFWSQMENTSLFCNSAAFAAAAATEAVNIGGTPTMPSMPSALFQTPGLDGSHNAFQSLAQLPGAFNLNSLTHPHHTDLDTSPFDQHSSIHNNSLHAAAHSQNSFWPSSSPPRRDNLANMNFGNHQHSHNNAANALGQKLPTEFRTVMLPTEEKMLNESQQHRNLSHNATNSPNAGHLDHLGYGNSGSNNNMLGVGNTVVCQVCMSAPSNGLHFGAKVCAACAAFFRRSVSDEKKYICKRNQRCALKVNDSTGYRKICRECRFKKCLYIGMLPENVQHKRHRRDDPLHHNVGNSLHQTGFRHHQQNPSPSMSTSTASSNLMALHNTNLANLNPLSGIGALPNSDYLGFFNKPSIVSSVPSSLPSTSSPLRQTNNTSPSTVSANTGFTPVSQSNPSLGSPWQSAMIQQQLVDNQSQHVKSELGK
uniref:Nuclear receptor domain-containing protein n=1 Tax=Panagrellus redivivus TaxID=6233 RepID=A0A7E4UT45_PANRE